MARSGGHRSGRGEEAAEGWSVDGFSAAAGTRGTATTNLTMMFSAESGDLSV